jgi:hypothetical protein
MMEKLRGKDMQQAQDAVSSAESIPVYGRHRSQQYGGGSRRYSQGN